MNNSKKLSQADRIAQIRKLCDEGWAGLSKDPMWANDAHVQFVNESYYNVRWLLDLCERQQRVLDACKGIALAFFISIGLVAGVWGLLGLFNKFDGYIIVPPEKDIHFYKKCGREN